MPDKYLEQAIGVMKDCGPALKELACKHGLNRRDYINGKIDLGWIYRRLCDGTSIEAVRTSYLTRVASAMDEDSAIFSQPYKRNWEAKLADGVSRLLPKTAKLTAAMLVFAGLSGCLADDNALYPMKANCHLVGDYNIAHDGDIGPQGNEKVAVNCDCGDEIYVDFETSEITGDAESDFDINKVKGKAEIRFRWGGDWRTEEFGSFSEAWDFYTSHTDKERELLAPAELEEKPKGATGSIEEYKGFHYVQVSRWLSSEDSDSEGEVMISEEAKTYYLLAAKRVTWDENGERNLKTDSIYFDTKEDLEEKIDEDMYIGKI